MKSEKGLVHLLIAGEIVLLVLLVVFGIVKQVSEPEENTEIVVSTQNNVFEEENETETENTESTELAVEPIVFSDEVEAMLAEMTVEQKVAQLFIVSPETLTDNARVTVAGNGTRTALGNYPVGGMLYTASNYLGRTQMEDLIKGAQEMSLEISGQNLFAGTRVEIEEQPMLAVAWTGAERILANLLRVAGDTDRASVEGLVLMSYIETAEQLASLAGGEGLCCVAIEPNQLDAVTMLQNGADMLCITTDFPVVYETVLEAVEDGTLTEEQIRVAVGRILTQKAALNEQVVEE